nr:uncharacterized protein LOC109151977 [Ipomoea batatas]
MELACAEEADKEPACVEGAGMEPENTGDDGTEARCDVRGLKAGPDDEGAASDPTVVTSKADGGLCCTGTGAAIVVTAKPIAVENPIPTFAALINAMNIGNPVNFNPNDNTSLFHLHANESPTLKLMSLVLDSNNYHEWARAMKMALFSKNKFGFVNGSIKMPGRDDPKFFFWERCNNMVVS